MLSQATTINGFTAIMDQWKEDAEFSKKWIDSLDGFFGSISNDNAITLIHMVSYCSQSLSTDSPLSPIWIHTLKRTIPKGFKFLPPTQYYENWVKGLLVLKVIKSQVERYETAGVYSPRLFNIIAALCMFNYFERYSSMSARDTIPEGAVAYSENDVLHMCCNLDKSIVLFPLAFISSHVMDIFMQPSNIPRSMDSIFQFLNDYFSIDYISEFKDVKEYPDFHVDSKTVKEWRNVLFSASYERNMERALIVDTLLVDLVFSENCTFSLSEGSFNKASQDLPLKHHFVHHEKEFLKAWKSHIHTISSPLKVLFFKCIFLRDALCLSTMPTCCAKVSLCILAKDKLTNRISFRGIINAVSVMNRELGSSAERIEQIDQQLDRFLAQILTSKLMLIEFVAILTSDSLLGISRNSPGFLVHLIQKLEHFEEILPDDANFELRESSWKCYIPHFFLPEKVAQVYIDFYQSKPLVYRRRILEQFVSFLEKEPDIGLSNFLDFLEILSGTRKIDGATDHTVISMAYFDFLKLIESSLCDFLKLKILVHYYYEKMNPVVVDFEEGEEPQEVKPMSEMQAAKLFYGQFMAKLEASSPHQFYKDPANKAYSNILLFSKLMNPPPVSRDEFSSLKMAMIEKWNVLCIQMPSKLFQLLLEDVIHSQYPTNQKRMLDHVFVEFLFFHAHDFNSTVNYMRKLLDTPKLEYHSDSGPFHAFIDHFKETRQSSKAWNKSEELEFLNYLTKAVLLSLANISIPQVRQRTKSQGSKDPYGPFISVSKCITPTLDLLLDCLMNAIPALQETYFAELVEKCKFRQLPNTGLHPVETYKIDFHETLLVLLLKHPRATHLLTDRAIKVMFDLSSKTLSLRSLGLSFAVTFIQDYINMYPASPTRNALLTSLLGSSDPLFLQNAKYLNTIKEMIFAPCLFLHDAAAKTWIPRIVPIALSTENDTVAKKLLEMCLSYRWNAFSKTTGLEAMLTLISKEDTTESLNSLLSIWKAHLITNKDNTVLFSAYANQYSDVVKQVFFQVLDHATTTSHTVFYTLLKFMITTSSTGLELLIHQFSKEYFDQQHIKDNITTAISNFAMNFYIHYHAKEDPADLDAEMDPVVEKFCIFVSNWIDHCPFVTEAFSQPDIVSSFIGIMNSSRLQVLLSLFYKIYSQESFLAQDRLKPLLRSSDLLWSLNLVKLSSLCMGNGMINSFVQITTIFCKAFLPQFQDFGLALIPLVLSLIENNDSDVLHGLLTFCTPCSSFVIQVGPNIKRWLLTRSNYPTRLELFKIWHQKATRKSLDPLLYQHFADLLKDTTSAAIVLEILNECPEIELVDCLPAIIPCLQQSSLNKLAEKLILRIKKPLKASPIELKWFEKVLESGISNSSPAGVQSLVYHSMTVIRAS